MDCCLRLGYRRLGPLNLRWSTVQVCVTTVWTDGSGRHSSDPHHRRCGVGYHTDTDERVFCALPGIKQSVYRAELHA
eukprot:6484794-Amphidinium_carterae.1